MLSDRGHLQITERLSVAYGDLWTSGGFPGGSVVKSRETKVGSLGWEDLLEKGMATHSSILAWKVPWTE